MVHRIFTAPPTPPRGFRVLAFLVLAAALVVGGAIMINTMLAERLLRADAEASTRRLAGILAGRSAEAPPLATGQGHILQWRLLASDGTVLEAVAQPTPRPERGLRLTEVSLPFGDAGLILEAVVDQSDQQARYREAFLLAEIAIALFGIGAAALLAWLGLRRHSERSAEVQAQFFRKHDALTGLATHAECRERLDLAVALAARQSFQVGVLVVDLRRFREVNEAHGRANGDAVLNVIAARLRDAVRREDIVARLSADRFAVVQSAMASALGATSLAERLALAVSDTVQIGGVEVHCVADIGFAVAPEDGTTAEILLARAEHALRLARAEPEAGLRAFEHGQDVALRAQREMERDLRLAVAGDQLVLHWQPQRRIADGRLLGFEALLRWQHPIRGMIPPNDFIPLAEATGLIVPIGAWVLRTACAEAATWPGAFTAAVNLSPAQFQHGGLVATVQGALEASRLPPARLELEITESLLQKDTDSAVRLLHALRGLGVNIAMDDFGTGWSSLAHLWRFPFGKLKIDRAFIKDLGRDPKLSAIVATVVGLGRTLDMALVAEGVETEDQARLLLSQGCEQGQGWLYGRPLPAEAARALIAEELALRTRSAA